MSTHQNPNDPIINTLSPEAAQLPAPTLADAGFWALLWAAIRSLILGITSLVSRSDRTALATEHLAHTVSSYANRPAHAKSIKLESPNVFAGDSDQVEAFLNELNLYFAGTGITDDAARIIFALSLTKGGTGKIATNWADLQRKAIVAGQTKPDTKRIQTWADFVKEFTAYFQTTSSKDEAQWKLSQLKQGNKTADEYITLFKGLADATQFDNEALLHHFKTGLNVPLARAVWALRPMPETYDEWMTEASAQDRVFRMGKEYESKRNARTEQPSKQRLPSAQFAAPKPVEKPADAMDVDQQRRQNVVCYSCGERGHIARFCPKTKPRFNVREMSQEDYEDLIQQLQDFRTHQQ